jgi:hypothetical protein
VTEALPRPGSSSAARAVVREIDLRLLWAIPPQELARLTIAQTGRYLLLEFPYRSWPLALDSSVSGLVRRGITARGALAAAAEAVGDDVLARYLTREAPAAIVAGEPVPPAPQVGLGA